MLGHGFGGSKHDVAREARGLVAVRDAELRGRRGQVVAHRARGEGGASGDLLDRGAVAPGMRADLNVIDLDELGFEVPRMAFDLPAGGRRLVQRGRGYHATFVAGVQTVADDEHTGELPGRLVRGPQPAPR